MDTIYLDVELMEKMCHPLAMAVFDSNDDPISPFSHHTIELLESALNSPRHTFGGLELYPTLTDKATILFYSLIQNHPFQNGNKRIAAASLLVFLHLNNHWLEAEAKELANWAIKIARSGEQPVNQEKILPELRTWLENNITSL